MSEKIAKAQSHIKGSLVAHIIVEFWQEFQGVYGDDVTASSLCAVGPLQSMIGLAIEKGYLKLGDKLQ